MRSNIRATGSGILLAFAACNATALGFGRETHASTLGQPLVFTVPLRFDTDEFVSSECVSVEVLAGEQRVPPPNVQVSVSRTGAAGEHALRITTTSLIDEPIVSVNVGIGCPVRLSRQFVAFIDPPQVNLAQSAPAVSEPALADAPTADRARKEPPPVVAAAPASAAAEPPAQPVARKPRPARAVARAATKRPVPEAPREARPAAEVAPRTATAPAASSGSPRLQLEASELLARRPAPSASAPAVAPPGRAPASVVAGASAPVDDAAALARQAAQALAATLPPDQAAAQAEAQREHERIRSLEESLARLVAETKSTQDTVATLQARLREAEAARHSNPLVYALVAAVGALLLVVATLLWWTRERQRRRDAWWAAAAEEAEQRGRPRIAAPPALAAPAPAAVAATADATVIAPRAAPAGPVTWKPTAAIPELDTRDVPRRAVSAEELIDLEQQAEFFVTLGQDDAAIALLDSHIETAGGVSPMPYLKLLDIHRRRGDRDAYEHARQRFNQRFNGYAPAWDATAAVSQPLEERADVVARLQAVWSTPPRAMGVLEQMLFRTTAGEAAFDLDAYREVLFLHEIARDLAERQPPVSSVDLELPIGPEFMGANVVAHPLRATLSLAPDPEVVRPLRLDLDLDLDAAPAADRSASERARRDSGDLMLSEAGAQADEFVERPRFRSTRS
jgi:hypothetical protein